MSLSDDEITKLFKIRRTMLQMLLHRGYSVAEAEIKMSKQQFVEKFGENMKRENLVIHSVRPSDSSDQMRNGSCGSYPGARKQELYHFVSYLATLFCSENLCLLIIYVFFPEELKVSTSQIRTYITRMKSENVSRAILVVQQVVTPYAKRCIEEVSRRFRMEVFEDAEVVVNITEHVLVPRHEVLTDELKKKLLAEYSVEETKLPRILVSDPVAKYYGLRHGQIVKIYRESETAGEYITYRYAV
ncbi:DNA-directed RNA polymerases II and IV subunit 5A-like isoform X1 [Malania oleifera]|uniref:DNA-directed RNA polymerases II and IV subunit 5A-like isoform X1 n=1 Tax=Malania oleifera TaxID=397392 RepID=UPI0025AEB55F|nr:DNA-directed RNA polymerases II and IV subunit 5A-like isoform X1 [Malania oleifera]